MNRRLRGAQRVGGAVGAASPRRRAALEYSRQSIPFLRLRLRVRYPRRPWLIARGSGLWSYQYQGVAWGGCWSGCDECNRKGHAGGGVLLPHRRRHQIRLLPLLRKPPGLDLPTLVPCYGEHEASRNHNPGHAWRAGLRMSWFTTCYLICPLSSARHAMLTPQRYGFFSCLEICNQMLSLN